MELIEKRPNGMMVVLMSGDETGILNDALNEVCNGIDVPEFQTRMGCTEAEAEKLLSELRSFLS